MNQTSINQDIEIFTHNITWLRQHHKLSKTKMANILGIGLKTLNQLERGILPPRMTIDVLFAIYDHFGISPFHQLTKWLSD